MTANTQSLAMATPTPNSPAELSQQSDNLADSQQQYTAAPYMLSRAQLTQALIAPTFTYDQEPVQHPPPLYPMAQPCVQCQFHALMYPPCAHCNGPQKTSAECLSAPNSALHTKICGPYLPWTSHRRPEGFVLALYIPFIGPPSFRYVQLMDDGPGGILRPDLSKLLGDNVVKRMLTNHVREREVLGYELHLYQKRGVQAPNRFVVGLVRDTGFARSWGGPLVVLACESMKTGISDGKGWNDTKIEDLIWMFDYWCYGNEPSLRLQDLPLNTPLAPPIRQMDWTATAVIITCKAESSSFGGCTFNQGIIHADHPVWRETPMLISKKVGFPLVMHKFPTQAVLTAKPITHPDFDNEFARAMNRVFDLQAPDWGCFTQEYRENCGTVIIARADRKNLSVQMAMLASLYHTEYLDPQIDKVFRHADIQEARKFKKEIVEDATPADFHRFLARERFALLDNHPIWGEAGSPYHNIQGPTVERWFDESSDSAPRRPLMSMESASDIDNMTTTAKRQIATLQGMAAAASHSLDVHERGKRQKTGKESFMLSTCNGDD